MTANSSFDTLHDDSRSGAPEFFSLNGRYVLAPETTATQVGHDLECLLASIEGLLTEMAPKVEKETMGVWPATYLARQAQSLFTAYQHLQKRDLHWDAPQ